MFLTGTWIYYRRLLAPLDPLLFDPDTLIPGEQFNEMFSFVNIGSMYI